MAIIYRYSMHTWELLPLSLLNLWASGDFLTIFVVIIVLVVPAVND